MQCLIIALPQDTQVSAISFGLSQLGLKCDVLYPLDISDGSSWTWSPRQRLLSVARAGEIAEYSVGDYDSVWFRRPPSIFPSAHISDTIERAIAEEEHSILVKSVYEALDQSSFCVNPYGSTLRAANKTFQFSKAVEFGLNLPRTIISNSKHEISSFFSECNGRMIYKPLKPGVWVVNTNGHSRLPEVPTTVVTQELLDCVDLSASPGIYQQLIEKKAEIRATIIGRSIFAWKKEFSRKDLDIDWRLMHANAEISLCEIEDTIANKIFALMDELDLVFGCVDLVIDSQDQIYFLEINPQGQFLWGDQYDLGLNQYEAFCEFLAARDPTFKYTQRDRLQLKQFSKIQSEKWHSDEVANHHGSLGRSCFHQVSNTLLPLDNAQKIQCC